MGPLRDGGSKKRAARNFPELPGILASDRTVAENREPKSGIPGPGASGLAKVELLEPALIDKDLRAIRKLNPPERVGTGWKLLHSAGHSRALTTEGTERFLPWRGISGGSGRSVSSAREP